MTLDYSLFQPDIFSFFQEGYPVALGERLAPDIYFARAIATACKDIAERFDCSLTLSENRLEETRLHWARDLQRIDIANSKIPDHFKTTGFLAYWLRRRIVVQYVICKETAIPVEQTYFLNFANEVCAFTIAFQLSLYFQYRFMCTLPLTPHGKSTSYYKLF